MEEKKDTPITYHDFLMYTAANYQPQAFVQLDEAAGGEKIKVKEIEKQEEPKKQPQKNPEGQQKPKTQNQETANLTLLTDLCRVCGNKGNISLYTEPPEKLMCFKPFLECPKNVTIGQMISEISGEDVDKSDFLPQFVCAHCLGYLQHAYNIRCRILDTTNNFKLMQKLYAEEGSPDQLPSIPTISENTREILETKEEIEGTKYWNETITKKTSKITIGVPSTTKRNERITEHKCVHCLKRVYSIKSLNQHMEICIISQLTTFFSQLQLLFKNFCDKTMSSFNYQMQAMSLIYNCNKHLRKIAKKSKFDIRTFSPETSASTDASRKLAEPTAARRPNNSYNRFYSPDNGYNSGNV